MKRRHILKTVCFFLAASGLLLATACGNKTEDTDTEAVTASDDTAADASTDTAADKPSTTEERETGTEDGTEDGTEAETSKTGTTAPASSGKSTTAAQTGTGSSPSPAPSGGGSTPSASSPSPSAPPASSGSSTTAAPAAGAPTEHTHSWVASTQTVYHEEEGHYERVCVDPGATWPLYATHTICDGCGFDYTLHPEEPAPHICPDGLRHTYGGRSVIVGEQVLPPVYENQWVVDKAEWTETVTTYTCSGCGAKK